MSIHSHAVVSNIILCRIYGVHHTCIRVCKIVYLQQRWMEKVTEQGSNHFGRKLCSLFGSIGRDTCLEICKKWSLGGMFCIIRRIPRYCTIWSNYYLFRSLRNSLTTNFDSLERLKNQLDGFFTGKTPAFYEASITKWPEKKTKNCRPNSVGNLREFSRHNNTSIFTYLVYSSSNCVGSGV